MIDFESRVYLFGMEQVTGDMEVRTPLVKNT